MKNQEIAPVQLGRPVNMNSARQIRLAEIKAKREAGLIKFNANPIKINLI